MRGVRLSASTTHSRSGVRRLLGRHCRAHASAVPAMRRSASLVAGDQRCCHDVPALPQACVCRGVQPCDWRLRGPAPLDRARVEVSRVPYPGNGARSADAHMRRRVARRRGHRGSSPAPSPASGFTRFQPGGGSRQASWCPGRRRLETPPCDPIADRLACGAASCERAGCIRPAPRAGRPRAADRRRGRCEHHRRDGGGLRARAERGGRARGQRADCSSSRVSTARMTSAATSSFTRSPSTRTQPGDDA